MNSMHIVPTCLHMTNTDPLLPVQPSPHRRDERPVSCYTPGSNSHLQSGLGSAGRDAVNLGKDKQRSYMPNLVNNETYGTILNTNPPQPGLPTTTSAPPLPPRNLGKIAADWSEIYLEICNIIRWEEKSATSLFMCC